MASLIEIMQLCRLCLVKDQVNIPIFEEQGDIRQIFLKISACLPVKVSREDDLPKKICDGCSYKLEILYQFWNTSANSEKQLLKWLSQVGAEKAPASDKVAVAPVQPHSMPSDGVILKQEVVDLADSHSADEIAPDDLNVSNDAQDYIMQQQQLSYQPISFQFQQDGFAEGEGATNASGPSATVTSQATEAAPKRKRRAAAMKALPAHIDSEEEDEDDVDMVETKIAKTEEQSDDSGGEDPEPTAFVGVPSTSTDNEQPGPSGVGKGPAEAPFDPLTETMPEAVSQTIYECEVCTQIFSTKKDFLAHHMNQFGETFRCCRCDDEFKTTTELYNHYELHKNGTVIIENEESTEFDYSENVEAVMNIPNEPINDTDELLYILDGSQCINEVVIEEESEGQEMETETDTSGIKPENFTIVQVEHGYMLPSVFKGQLESKRRYKKRESVSLTESFTEEDSGTETVSKPEPAPSRTTYSSSSVPKSRPKRRHEVPDFSATNYVVLNPNEEVDIPHYKCLRCEQLFISKFTFFRHIEKGKCYINSCDVCSASFNRNSEFYDHYLAEHTDRAICNFCFRTFMYEKNVKEHMLRHLDQFRHRCEECNKGFYTVREYRNHYKNRHMGIRHKCEVCGRSFADEYYFKRHVATHEKALASKVELSVYK